MNFYKDYVENGKEYSNYDELKKGFKIKIPDNFNFAYDIVDRYATEDGEKKALVWCDDKGDERIFTFAQMSKESNKAANFLVSNGIKKGDIVMLILRRRWEFWPILLALHKIGAVAVPATNLLLQEDIEYRTNAAGIKMIISIEDNNIQTEIEHAVPNSPSVEKLVTLGKNRDGWISYDFEIDSCADTFARPEGKFASQNNDIMLLYFTSGTSGYPKMVQHNFLYPLGHIVTAKYWQNVVDNGLHLTVAETGWAKAVWGKIYGQWICGSAVFAYDMIQFKPQLMLQKMEKYHVTTFCAPPTVYRYLIRTDLKKYNLSALRYCVTAGEALNPEVYNKFCQLTGIKMFEAYGQTEATVMVGNFPGMEPKPGSMGKAAPGYDIDVVRPDGTSCAPMEEGSIIIKMDEGRPFGLFTGYFNNDSLTEKVFEGGIYHTGDTAYYDKDGYIWFVGRNDDIIKTSGYRISPFEIESILQQHPAVLECAVTGIPDKHRGQAIKATVVLAKGYEATKRLAQEILDFAKQKTASYKHPRVLEFAQELPKTISGKIRRVEIRDKDGQSA